MAPRVTRSPFYSGAVRLLDPGARSDGCPNPIRSGGTFFAPAPSALPAACRTGGPGRRRVVLGPVVTLALLAMLLWARPAIAGEAGAAGGFFSADTVRKLQDMIQQTKQRTGQDIAVE